MPLVLESTLVEADAHRLEQELRLQEQPQPPTVTADQVVAATLVRCVSSAQLRWPPPPRQPKA